MRKSHARSFSCDFTQKSGTVPPFLRSVDRTVSEVDLSICNRNYSCYSAEVADSGVSSRSETPRFLDDGGLSITPVADGYFPQPQEGQSIVQYLLGISQSSRRYAELDRENAHFNISEVMISVIEQVKFGQSCSNYAGPRSSTPCSIRGPSARAYSDLRHGYHQIPMKSPEWYTSEASPCISRQAYPCNVRSSRIPSPSNESTSGAFSCTSSPPLFQESSMNLSCDLDDEPAGLQCLSIDSKPDYTGNEPIQHRQSEMESSSELADSFMSAEGVALALISKFSDDFLPKAADMEWVVKEGDAPQILLPLPEVVTAEECLPDEDDKFSEMVLRGTKEWAPPRPQIVFTVHATPNVKVQVARQNYRCAGCGLKVDRRYVRRFRYCEYFGKYFCTGCHGNRTSIIPARVLKKWDFNRYPVSNFAATLLERMWYDPLFNVSDLNPALFRRSRELERTTQYRKELQPVAEYIKNCRHCQELTTRLSTDFANLERDPFVFSLHDLIRVYSGDLPTNLRLYISDCCDHIVNCPLCRARGFLCEPCGSDEIIFPFSSNVERCVKCGACAHTKCFNRDKCPRCARLEIRRQQRTRTLDA